MNSLQERVRKMLDGETKRREVAIEWLSEVSDILALVSADIWGKNLDDYSHLVNAVKLTEKAENDEYDKTNLLFRYGAFTIDDETVRNDCGFQYWRWDLEGVNVENINTLKGKDFWNALRIIMAWLPIATEAMDTEENSRNTFIAKLNTEMF